MRRPKAHNKGIALMIVLGVIMVVVALANVVLQNMLNQSRLSHHQTSRIQNYYALQGAMTITFDKIRRGVWAPNLATSYTYTFCNGGCTYNDAAFPFQVVANIGAQNPLNQNLRPVTFSVDYTYTPD